MSRCLEDVKLRRCFTDPHYWKNPALRRSREKIRCAKLHGVCVQAEDAVSEGLRRWTRNPSGSARRSSNFLGVFAGWRAGTENSWRLAGGCVACTEEVAAEEELCPSGSFCAWATPTEGLSNMKKSRGVLEKTTPPVGLEPTVFRLEVRRLVH